MRTTTKIVACLAIVLAASSCSSSDGGSEADTTRPRQTTTTRLGETTTTSTEPPETTTTEDLLAELPEPGSYEAAIVANASSGANGATLTTEEAECVAPKWVEVAGADRLEANEVTPAVLQQGIDAGFNKIGMSEDEGGALVDALTGCCVDLLELYQRSADFQALDAETQTCAEGALTETLVRRLLVVTMTTGSDAVQADPAIVQELTTLFTACPGMLSLD